MQFLNAETTAFWKTNVVEQPHGQIYGLSETWPHNLGFLKQDGFSIQKLHSKSVIFAMPFNFLNKPLSGVWLTGYTRIHVFQA